MLATMHDDIFKSEAVQLGTRILRMSAGQATVVQDATVGLSLEERRDRAAVVREQMRIFGTF